MEQILITRANSTVELINSSSTVTSIISAEHRKAALGEDVVVMTVEMAIDRAFSIGDSIKLFGGNTYKINQLPSVEKISERQFRYDLVFEGIQYDLLRVLYRNEDVSSFSTSSEFALTGDIEMFLNVLINNANRTFGANKWALGEFPTGTETKNLLFSNENCLSVLQRICSEYSYEFTFTETSTQKILSVKRLGAELDFTFEYGKGKGLYNLKRDSVDSKKIVNKLFVYGSTKNIPANYKNYSQRLHFGTVSPFAESVVSDTASITAFGVCEGSVIFDDVFPTGYNSITGINASNRLEFTDSSMSFDLNAKDGPGNTLYLISGVTAKVHFNSGNLAGYEFEIEKYTHSTKKFILKPVTDEKGLSFPSLTESAFQLGVGDTYSLLDIVMPQSLIEAAESLLQSKGVDYLNENKNPIVKYSVVIDEEYLKSKTTELNIFEVGDSVVIKDNDFNINTRIKIISFSRDVLNPYKYSIVVSDVPEIGVLRSLAIKAVETERINRHNGFNDPIKFKQDPNSNNQIQSQIDETINRKPSVIIGRESTGVTIGNKANDTLVEILGRFGIRNTNNFLGQFSVAGLTANTTFVLPNNNVGGVVNINDWNFITNKPDLSIIPDHFHQIGHIVNLSEALAGKQPLNANLTSLGQINSNGIVRRTGANTFGIGTNDPITLSGDVTGTGTTNIVVTLKNVATAGEYKSVVVNSKGLATGGTLKATPSYLSDFGFQEDFATQSETFWNSKIDDFIEFGSDIQINGGLGVIGSLFVGGNFFDKDSSAGTANQVLMPVSGGGVAWTSLSTAQISNFSANVLGQVLTGFTAGSNTPLNSSNTILTGFQNLDARITAKANAFIGTTNYLTKFTSATGLGDSIVYENSNKIGIGTTTADRKLVVNGQIGFSYPDGNSYVGLSSTSDSLGLQFFAGVTSSETNNSYRFSNHVGENIFVIQNGGNVGIGTTFPLVKLESRITNVGVAATSGTAQNNAALRISTTASTGILDFGLNGANNWIQSTDRTDLSQGYKLLLNPNGGNVGIGTIPLFTLDVNGTGRFTGQAQFDSIPTCSVAPTSANHLTNKAYVDSLSLIKRGDTVKTISLTTLTKSGLYAVNGYTLTDGDLVLDAGGTSGGGVWVASSGSWSRSTTNDSDSEIRGAYHYITAGTYANSRYINTNTSSITLDSTAIIYDVDFGAETDPIWEAYKTANDLTPTRFGNWNTAYGWGNHANLYVDKVSAQSDIAGAKKFTTSIQSPIAKFGTDSVNLSTLNAFGNTPRIASTGVFSLFSATGDFSWSRNGELTMMRLTGSGLRVGDNGTPAYMLDILGTVGFTGLLSVGRPSVGIPMSSGTVGQFFRRSQILNGYGVYSDVNNWANITVADISDISTAYQAKITGTENYLTKKTATNFGDSQIFDNGTFLVIGGTTAIDGSKFSVIGKIGATSARIGDNANGIDIGSLSINSTGALNYGGTSHVWNVSSTEKMSLNGSRLAITGDFELTGKLKVNGSFGEDHFFLKTLGVDGGGNPLGTEWAVLNCGEISDIDTLYASKSFADANYIKRVTDEGERGFFLYGDVNNTVKEGFMFTNPDTGILGIHAYRLNGSTVEQYGFQLDKDGLPYWQFADGKRKRILTELDAVGGGGTWAGGTVSTSLDYQRGKEERFLDNNNAVVHKKYSTGVGDHSYVESTIGKQLITATQDVFLNAGTGFVYIDNVAIDMTNVASLVNQNARFYITSPSPGKYTATLVAV